MKEIEIVLTGEKEYHNLIDIQEIKTIYQEAETEIEQVEINFAQQEKTLWFFSRWEFASVVAKKNTNPKIGYIEIYPGMFRYLFDYQSCTFLQKSGLKRIPGLHINELESGVQKRLLRRINLALIEEIGHTIDYKNKELIKRKATWEFTTATIAICLAILSICMTIALLLLAIVDNLLYFLGAPMIVVLLLCSFKPIRKTLHDKNPMEKNVLGFIEKYQNKNVVIQR